MNVKNLGLNLACAGALALTQVAGAQTYGSQGQYGQQSSQGAYGTQGQAGTSQALSSEDKSFLTSTAEKNLAAIRAGQIAERKATTPGIQNFARQQIQTNRTMLNQLDTIARQHGVTAPTTLSSSYGQQVARLNSASGTAFEQEYSRWAAQNQQAMLNSLQRESQSGMNPAVKNFATTNTSTVEASLRTAQSLERGGGAAAAGAPGMGQTGQSGQTGQQSKPY